MKKIFLTTLIVALVSLFLAVPAFAKTSVIKGTVTALNGHGTITVLTNKGETLLITLPAGFAQDSLKVGDMVLIKGQTQAGGPLLVESIRLVDESETQDPPDEDNPEGKHENSRKIFLADKLLPASPVCTAP